MESGDSNGDGPKDGKRDARGLDGYVARRIANMSPVDWKNTPNERRTEFLRAARRAIAAIGKYEKLNTAKRQEKLKERDAKRRERREEILRTRKANASNARNAS